MNRFGASTASGSSIGARPTRRFWRRSTDSAATWQAIGTFPFGTLDGPAGMDGDKEVFGRVYMGLGGSGWVVGEPR